MTGSREAPDYRGRATCQHKEREGESNEEESFSSFYGSGDGGSNANERICSRKPVHKLQQQ